MKLADIRWRDKTGFECTTHIQVLPDIFGFFGNICCLLWGVIISVAALFLYFVRTLSGVIFEDYHSCYEG